MMSTPRCSAQRRSASSLSLRAGTLTATPGRLMPLWSETGPATTTSVVTSVSVTPVARRATLPSSISSGSPTETSPGRPLWVVEQISRVPGTSRTVIVKVSPTSSSCGPSEKLPRRILGPCRSARIATVVSSSSLARRMFS